MTIVKLKRRAFFIVIISLFIACSYCSFNEKDLLELVELKFSYCRLGENLVLGLHIHYYGKVKRLPPRHELIFRLNDKPHSPPIKIYKASLYKWWWPEYPKGGYTYQTVSEFAGFLGPGKHKLQWKFGPLLSNELVFEVKKDLTLQELKIECEESVKRLSISAFSKKKSVDSGKVKSGHAKKLIEDQK